VELFKPFNPKLLQPILDDQLYHVWLLERVQLSYT
jgi:hypothetical protein